MATSTKANKDQAEDEGAEEVQSSRASADFATQDKPTVKAKDLPDAATQSYIWLADGSVLRVKNEDIPQAGHQHLGHWQRGDKVYVIVGIYPVEEKGLTDE